ncbi:MAG: type II toxin-antitoxin system RelE/ParE family toxin [Pseudomonadota bacterium]
MSWDVEVTDEFKGSWLDLIDRERDDVEAYVTLLEERGPQLDHPFSSKINGLKHAHMRELRVQSGGKPIRIFYAFNPVRTALLLIGGDKTGDKRFYDKYIPVADRLYDEHLEALGKESLV